MDNYRNVKKYKLEAVLKTTGGLLQVKCKMSDDGCIDGVFIDETGEWTRLFFDINEVKSYLIYSLHVENIIEMIEVF